MTQREQLSRSLRKIFWGYIFLYFDIKLGTIDVLPAWLGYVFFYQGIRNGIEVEENSAKLLKPICMALIIYSLINWIMTMFGIGIDILIISDLFAVIALYFHFQLLTNLANIADRYSYLNVNALLNLRTIHTVLMTTLAFTVHFDEIEWLSMLIVVVQVIVMICICSVIAKFRHFIDDME